MKKRTAPNWDEFGGRRMFVPFFIYGRDDLEAGPLHGFCRGHGALGITEKRHHDTIGIYTAEGVYHNVVVDTRLKGAVPTFFIEDKPFFYPLVACCTMCHGLPVIDPTTGIMRQSPIEAERS